MQMLVFYTAPIEDHLVFTTAFFVPVVEFMPPFV